MTSISCSALRQIQILKVNVFFTYAGIGVVCFNARLGFFNKSGDGDEKAVEFLNATKDVFKLLHDSYSGASILHKWFRNKTYRDYEKAYNILKKSGSSIIVVYILFNTQIPIHISIHNKLLEHRFTNFFEWRPPFIKVM